MKECGQVPCDEDESGMASRRAPGRARVLVAGASGFIGGAIVAALARSGTVERVVALCRNVAKAAAKLPGPDSGVDIHAWDMVDPVPDVGRVDAVIHAAGRGDPQSYARHPHLCMRETLLGCLNLLDFSVSAGVRDFVLVSSGEVYGNVAGTGRIREDEQGGVSPEQPRSTYPVVKAACESLCLAAGRERGLSTRVARLCHVYGPGMSPDDPRIAAHFPVTAAAGRDIVLKSPGDQVRSYCYIADAVSGILAILEKGVAGEVYNVADESTEMSIRQFAERTAAAAGVGVRFETPAETESAAFNPMPRSVFATDRLRALGWRPRTDFERGIRQTVAGFRRTMAG